MSALRELRLGLRVAGRCAGKKSEVSQQRRDEAAHEGLGSHLEVFNNVSRSEFFDSYINLERSKIDDRVWLDNHTQVLACDYAESSLWTRMVCCQCKLYNGSQNYGFMDLQIQA